ncbi:hypothetical protein Bca52824_063362 [Brassica carinata]|nr:hypothetical protein Bca52824_063362 [Brassica carinata]
MTVLFCRKAVCYGQTRFTEILHFVSLQSTPKPQPKEKKQPAPREEEPKQPDLKTCQAASSTPQASPQGPKPKKPLLITKEPIAFKHVSSPRNQLQPQQQTETKEAQPSVSQTKLTPTPPPSPSPATTKPNADSAQPPSKTEVEKAPEIVAAALPASEIQRPSSSKETIMEETLRVTRGSLRKARSTGNTLKEK